MGGTGLTEYYLKSSLDSTLGDFLYIFPLYFMVLLKQLWRLYIGGFIFQVPPVSDYSTCYANRVPTRSVQQPRVYMLVHQPLTYASSALIKH